MTVSGRRTVVLVDAPIEVLIRSTEPLRQSGDLLTLAPGADIVALRRWYLEEFDRQINGHEPQPWPRYAAQHRLA